MQRSIGIICMLLLLPFLATSADAELGMNETEQSLNLICDSDDDCFLSNGVLGEEMISGQENDANPLTPKVVSLEFTMQPSQNQLTLLPENLKSLVIDLEIREDLSGWSQPDLEVELKLGASENSWTIDGAGPALNAQPQSYELENESLDMSNGRMLLPGEIIRLRISFQLERPSNWELGLRSLSNLELDIDWSVDPAQADVDEPSSRQQPRQSSEVEIWHDGALLGDDSDCFEFDLEENELFNIIIIWEQVPIEVEQPHQTPDLIAPGNRNTPPPNVKTTSDGETETKTYQYRGLDNGKYRLCFDGRDDKFQPYSWLGRITYEGIGPNSPANFEGNTSWESGTTIMGDSSQSEIIEASGLFSLVFGLMMLFGVIGAAAVQPTWKWTRRLMLPLSGVLIILGGIAHPVSMWGESLPEEDSINIERLLENRLEQIWQVLAPGTPQNTLAEHLGSTFGVLAGEQLLMNIEVSKATQMEDGRYQLQSPEMEDIRIDRLIFNFLNEVGSGHSGDGLLPERSVSFVLQAGRALTLDLLILEALMVVEEVPQNSNIQIDWTMTNAGVSGSALNPVWVSRPTEVSLQDWSRLQTSLFPELISISYCDCGQDQMDLKWVPSTTLDPIDLPTPDGLTYAIGFGPSAAFMMFTGVLLIIITGFVETSRRRNAIRLAGDFYH
ncbi:MAG: hypothetical protein ACKVHH_05280 [Candidatus Poseidoniales archaeon]